MTNGGDPWEQGVPSEEDRLLAADHDDEGVDVALAIARTARGEPAGTVRRDDAGEVLLPPPRRSTQTRRRRAPTTPTWSGPRKDARDPMVLGDAFTNLVKSKGWGRQVNLHLVLSRWPELVGPTNAQHSRPVKYQGTVLTVRTEATVWATSLRTIAPQLVAELNRRLGEGTVTKVIIEGPTAPSWKHGPRSVPGRGPRDTYG
ncbi:DciA family protein [Cutibacterium equinum]|uniref:DciA family protein n=2 Tax=Cutibacterium equinum TaxID=3016342 RepID=A0ABY7QZ56_9ACTN|nr:DciA family protein [Cutibacterium equinum]WCC79985.1 DciA family protein [Cutibacterium equinum]